MFKIYTMLFLASIRCTLLLSVFLLPCIVIVQCHQNAELNNNIPYLDDVITYFMDPRPVYDMEDDESDESEFDFVGHTPSSSSKADEAVPNDKLAESAVKRDLLGDVEDSKDSSAFFGGTGSLNVEKNKSSSKKDKVESTNIKDDDELFAGIEQYILLMIL